MSEISRRTVLVGATGLGLVGARPGQTATSERERANEALVNAFCADWSKRDAAALTKYFSDDIVYQITTGMPLVKGKQQFVDQLGPFMQGFDQINWEILRSAAMGDVVLNERIDYFVAAESDRSRTYHVSGVFIIADGLITDWRDYPFPKAE